MNKAEALSYLRENERAVEALSDSEDYDIGQIVIEDQKDLSGSIFFKHGMASACRNSAKVNKENLMSWADYDGVRMYEFAQAGAGA